MSCCVTTSTHLSNAAFSFTSISLKQGIYYAHKAYHTGTMERFESRRKRMSLQELSDATGIPCSTLGNYEKDENADMSLGHLLTLADFYQVSTEYLLQQKLSELNLSTHLFLIKSYLFCRFIRCVNVFLMQRHNDNDDNKNRNNEIQ